MADLSSYGLNEILNMKNKKDSPTAFPFLFFSLYFSFLIFHFSFNCIHNRHDLGNVFPEGTTGLDILALGTCRAEAKNAQRFPFLGKHLAEIGGGLGCDFCDLHGNYMKNEILKMKNTE
jgi:hypothetical protein